MHSSHNTQVLMWFAPRMGVTSTELCFSIIAQGKANTVLLHLICSSRSSLLDLSSLPLCCLSYNILFPLSQSLRIVTCMLYKPATGFSKIATARTRTRARLLQQSTYPYCLFQSRLSNYLTNRPTLLQYKIYSYIGSPEVVPLQHCGPVPTVTQTLISDSQSSLSLR